ncbi:MAG: hypothetical protein QM820_64130 [Minicystis sp.]
MPKTFLVEFNESSPSNDRVSIEQAMMRVGGTYQIHEYRTHYWKVVGNDHTTSKQIREAIKRNGPNLVISSVQVQESTCSSGDDEIYGDDDGGGYSGFKSKQSYEKFYYGY